MNRSYSATIVVPNRGCRSCRSRRRGCGRSLPSCPNCRRQTSFPSHSQDGIPWHRGNDGRLVARGHQRGILSIRSRKLDVVKRQSETSRRKRNGFVLSLPRGLSLARLARGDLSPWTKKTLMTIHPIDSDMTDLYELLVNMSLCEDDVDFIQPSYQRLASPPPCMEIDMADLEEVSIPQEEEDSKPTPIETETKESAKPTASDESSVEEGEQKQEKEETGSAPESSSSSSSSSSATDNDKTSLVSILTPLHQETPIPEEDLAAILDSLLKHKDSSGSSSATKESDFPSVDRFLQIMEVISQLTESVMKPASTDPSKEESGKITALTPQHLAVIMNLRSLLDYATKVLCIKSIETPAKDSVMMGSSMEVVV